VIYSYWKNDSWIIIAYLRLAIITICNAKIIAIDATIGNNNALSWEEPSSTFSIESEILVTLSSKLELASSKVLSNFVVSCFRFSS